MSGESSPQAVAAVSGSAITDDRGFYELPALNPGDYRLSVSAQPWYAVAARPQRPLASDAAPLDPSLDVVYPITWYPGGTNPQTAETITLKAGENRQADFQLLPIPSTHLILPARSSMGAQETSRRFINFPQVEAISPGSFGQSISMTTLPGGEIDVSGLSPGLYRVRLPETAGHSERTSVVQVTSNSARNLDINAATTGSTVTLHLDGPPEANSVQVTFIDTTNPLISFRTNGANGMFGSVGHVRSAQVQSLSRPAATMRGQARDDSSLRSTESSKTIDLIPGQYRVLLGGNPNLFLTGLAVDGKNLPERIVSVPAGDSDLTLHIAAGRASVQGVVSLEHKPLPGAMVMLVPATLDDPGSITAMRRDQSNSDGSFDILQVIPGQYILVAVDRGWDINMNDPATLRHYLLLGVPLDLKPSAEVMQNLNAQAP
jgi:hypothetical protein